MAVPAAEVTAGAVLRVDWPLDKNVMHYAIVMAPPVGGEALMAVSTSEAPAGRPAFSKYCEVVDWSKSPWQEATGGRLTFVGASYFYPWFMERVPRECEDGGTTIDVWFQSLGQVKRIKNVRRFLDLLERWEADGSPDPR